MPEETEEHRPAPEAHDDQEQQENQEPRETKQCRICLDGEDPELGRLIRPCLCKGSISVRRFRLPAGHILVLISLWYYSMYT